MNDERTEYLLEAYLDNRLSDSEWSELRAILADADRENEIKDLLQAGMERQPPGQLYLERDYDALASRIMGVDLPTARVRRLPLRWAVAAAVFVLLAGIFLLTRHVHRDSSEVGKIARDVAPGGNRAILTLANGTQIVLDSAANGELAVQGKMRVFKTAGGELKYQPGATGEDVGTAYNTLVTPRGGQYHLILPDGSQVWLNAASSIRYPTAFSEGRRSVSMTGEAYFEVAENRAKPFQVKIGDHAAVDVLGTHFNVNAYSDEPDIRTTLLEGSVKLSQGTKGVLIRPGEQGLVSNGGIVVRETDTGAAVAWKNGFFQFKDADLATVMRQLARWYDITVRLEGGAGNAQFSGKIGRDLTLTQLLDGLSHQKVHYRLEEGRRLVITP
ncbi:MAG TPA: FecR domain-containing protein [Puia sp.]|nr:FecR domain-containing protein [Puia sp.]